MEKTKKTAVPTKPISNIESVDGKAPEGLINHHITKSFHLDDTYYRESPEELELILQELNDRLDSIGIKLTASSKTILQIDINEEKFRDVTTRKAGRKKKKTDVTIDEINEYRETHTAMETAAWLGLTRQTYYRKLKEHQAAGDSGNMEF